MEALKDNIASLVALNNVCVNILNAKIHPHDAAGLVQLQEQHRRLFKICYSEDWVRPKHHYSMHIEGQFELADMVLDTWPTERKHKVFKADLAPRIKHWQEFEKSVLMRWVEHDLDVLIREDFQQRLLQQLKKQDTPGLQFGKAVQTERGNTFRIGNVLLFKETDAWQAYEVASCFSYASGKWT